MFLSGPGGVGKSHVIKLIHSDTLKLLKLSGTFEPDDVVLLTAPTGVAVFNINSMTLHSALLLGHSKYSGFQPFSHDRSLFGGVSILAVGDLYQLPPVGQAPLFSTVTDCYAQLYGLGSLWGDNFLMVELTEIMRQRGDSALS